MVTKKRLLFCYQHKRGRATGVKHTMYYVATSLIFVTQPRLLLQQQLFKNFHQLFCAGVTQRWQFFGYVKQIVLYTRPAFIHTVVDIPNTDAIVFCFGVESTGWPKIVKPLPICQ